MDSGSNADFKDVKDWKCWYYPYLNKPRLKDIMDILMELLTRSSGDRAENLKMLIKAKNIDL